MIGSERFTGFLITLHHQIYISISASLTHSFAWQDIYKFRLQNKQFHDHRLLLIKVWLGSGIKVHNFPSKVKNLNDAGSFNVHIKHHTISAEPLPHMNEPIAKTISPTGKLPSTKITHHGGVWSQFLEKIMKIKKYRPCIFALGLKLSTERLFSNYSHFSVYGQ